MEIDNKVLPTTLFFREPSAMTTIVKKLSPRFGNKVQVASVGCSYGCEVYKQRKPHFLKAGSYPQCFQTSRLWK